MKKPRRYSESGMASILIIEMLYIGRLLGVATGKHGTSTHTVDIARLRCFVPALGVVVIQGRTVF
jgi:hypothetical protein